LYAVQFPQNGAIEGAGLPPGTGHKGRRFGAPSGGQPQPTGGAGAASDGPPVAPPHISSGPPLSLGRRADRARAPQRFCFVASSRRRAATGAAPRHVPPCRLPSGAVPKGFPVAQGTRSPRRPVGRRVASGHTVPADRKRLPHAPRAPCCAPLRSVRNVAPGAWGSEFALPRSENHPSRGGASGAPVPDDFLRLPARPL